MARARNIKPAFFENEQLAECEPLARLLFIALWTQADRAGRLEDRPKRLKAACLPYDDCDVDAKLNQLAAQGLIRRYKVNGEAYIDIPKFGIHQHPHHAEKPSNLPAFNGEVSGLPETCPRQTLGQTKCNPSDSLLLIPDSLKEEVCSEPDEPASEPHVSTNGADEIRGGESSQANGDALSTFPTVGKGPKTWTLTQAQVDDWAEAFPGVDVLAECRAARVWVDANPRKRKTAGGMKAFLVRWLTKEQNSGRTNGARAGPASRLPTAEEDANWNAHGTAE